MSLENAKKQMAIVARGMCTKMGSTSLLPEVLKILDFALEELPRDVNVYMALGSIYLSVAERCDSAGKGKRKRSKEVRDELNLSKEQLEQGIKRIAELMERLGAFTNGEKNRSLQEPTVDRPRMKIVRMVTVICG